MIRYKRQVSKEMSTTEAQTNTQCYNYDTVWKVHRHMFISFSV